MSNMYTAIIIIKILMHVLQPKLYRSINAVMYYYFPTPGMNENYVLCQQQYDYLESIADHIKASLFI